MKKISFERLTEKIENWEMEITNLLLKRHPYVSGKKIFVDIKDKDYMKASVAGEIVVDGKIIFPFIVRDREFSGLDVFVRNGVHYSATKKKILKALFDYSFFSRIETKEEKEILKATRQNLNNLFFNQSMGTDDPYFESFGSGKYAFDSFVVKKANEKEWKVCYSGPKGEHKSVEKDSFKVTDFICNTLFNKNAMDKTLFNKLKSAINKKLVKMAKDEREYFCSSSQNLFSLVPLEEEVTKTASEFSGSCRVYDSFGKEHFGLVLDANSFFGNRNEKFFVKEGGEYFRLNDNDVIVPDEYLFDVEKVASPFSVGKRGLVVTPDNQVFGPFQVNDKPVMDGDRAYFNVIADDMSSVKLAFDMKLSSVKSLPSVKTIVLPSKSSFVPLLEKMMGSPTEPAKNTTKVTITVMKDLGARAVDHSVGELLEDRDDDMFLSKMQGKGFSVPSLSGIFSTIRNALAGGESNGVFRSPGGGSMNMKVIQITPMKTAAELDLDSVSNPKFVAGKFDAAAYSDKLSKIEDVENIFAKMLVEMRKAGTAEDYPIKKMEKLVDSLGEITTYLGLAKDVKNSGTS